jgi:hypothetical protein
LTQHLLPPFTALFALAKFAVHAIDSIGLEPWQFDSLTGSNSCLADCSSPAQPTIS